MWNFETSRLIIGGPQSVKVAYHLVTRRALSAKVLLTDACNTIKGRIL